MPTQKRKVHLRILYCSISCASFLHCVICSVFFSSFLIFSIASYPWISGTNHTTASQYALFTTTSGPSHPSSIGCTAAQTHVLGNTAQRFAVIYLAKTANMGPGGPIADSCALEHPRMRFDNASVKVQLELLSQSPSTILYLSSQTSSLSSVLMIPGHQSLSSQEPSPQSFLPSTPWSVPYGTLNWSIPPRLFYSWIHYELPRSIPSPSRTLAV